VIFTTWKSHLCVVFRLNALHCQGLMLGTLSNGFSYFIHLHPIDKLWLQLRVFWYIVHFLNWRCFMTWFVFIIDYILWFSVLVLTGGSGQRKNWSRENHYSSFGLISKLVSKSVSRCWIIHFFNQRNINIGLLFSTTFCSLFVLFLALFWLIFAVFSI
jgi:hypothetical protein